MDYTSHQARVCWDPQRIQLSDILQAIASVGYKAHPFDPTQREKLIEEQKRKGFTRLLFSGLLGMEVMARATAGYWMGGVDAQGNLALWEILGRWTDFILVSIMLVYSGSEFYVSAWRDLKNRHLGMDLPIVIGLTTAYIGSVAATVQQAHDVYYDSIAMFIFFMLAARYYEFKGRLLAATSLDRLLKVIPKTSQRLTSKGQKNDLETVLITELALGDHVLINPGETVPVDGCLVEGNSSFDESLLTGEMMPVTYSSGANLVSGSCNIEQPVVMEVTRTYMESTLTDIHALLERGLESKTHYSLMAEIVAKWFVLAILIIASLTAIYWLVNDPEMALPITVSVLIVTCPCALALATPVALALSSGLFAKMGVLPIKMSMIEGLSQSDTVVFDKTGTLTEGQPTLTKTLVYNDSEFNEAQLQQIASSLEWLSEHPIAHAFKNGNEPAFLVDELKNHPGSGIAGEIDGQPWQIGKLSFCTDESSLKPPLKDLIHQARQETGIVIGLSRNQQLQGVFILHDPLRAGGQSMIEALKAQGVRNIAILSGDHPDSVSKVAKKLGITEYYGHMQPQDKLAWIQQQQAQGHHIVMVGDGINDAPTLAAADVSISFTSATDLAQINSDFIIMGKPINVIPKLRTLSQKTRRIIIQNLSWAAAYNFLAVPFAVMGWIPPWGAAIGMSLSSFIVISNSLRLRNSEL
ncbi:MAG: Type cbb3 cytochrome oxidase biogenesis protein CcoI; Copper-translocating P-type ATPase (EC [uncultured Thiotrichaceae bacterium]|uniref:Type cbb3 cytochrome oxidase biogenesis protein CcoI Copper-translocating P-type ATPase (EC) n=1 Tax=uncultured Thiotrichaceae bacterium TaxID=298394 RepID=A0A6S6SGV0_9GAMM|nr:MAG: Type cbb3 cytochrome oxidase biogenesis protein CcoI; Copper-translocating P-type ATPase (EC [uncultured Thiotrichaceae bacterium]